MMKTPPGRVAEVGILRLLFRLWGHIHSRRKKQAILISALMIISAFAEVATLGAVIPFITVLVVSEPKGKGRKQLFNNHP